MKVNDVHAAMTTALHNQPQDTVAAVINVIHGERESPPKASKIWKKDSMPEAWLQQNLLHHTCGSAQRVNRVDRAS